MYYQLINNTILWEGKNMIFRFPSRLVRRIQSTELTYSLTCLTSLTTPSYVVIITINEHSFFKSKLGICFKWPAATFAWKCLTEIREHVIRSTCILSNAQLLSSGRYHFCPVGIAGACSEYVHLKCVELKLKLTHKQENQDQRARLGIRLSVRSCRA